MYLLFPVRSTEEFRMNRLYTIADDFEATIRILTEAEGGRKTSPFNGIRWDFSYAADDSPEHLYMIWPDFYSATGDSLPKDLPLPLSVDIPARMIIVVDEMRDQVHRSRIKPGIEFYCHEGPKHVAVGRVTRVTGLYKDRASTT
jgi:translation elongation factor EF-Tu-like GTPase